MWPTPCGPRTPTDRNLLVNKMAKESLLEQSIQEYNDFLDGKDVEMLVITETIPKSIEA